MHAPVRPITQTSPTDHGTAAGHFEVGRLDCDIPERCNVSAPVSEGFRVRVLSTLGRCRRWLPLAGSATAPVGEHRAPAARRTLNLDRRQFNSPAPSHSCVIIISRGAGGRRGRSGRGAGLEEPASSGLVRLGKFKTRWSNLELQADRVRTQVERPPAQTLVSSALTALRTLLRSR